MSQTEDFAWGSVTRKFWTLYWSEGVEGVSVRGVYYRQQEGSILSVKGMNTPPWMSQHPLTEKSQKRLWVGKFFNTPVKFEDGDLFTLSPPLVYKVSEERWILSDWWINPPYNPLLNASVPNNVVKIYWRIYGQIE